MAYTLWHAPCCRSPVSIFPRAASYPYPHRHKTPREKLLEREVYGLRMQLSAIEASAGRGKSSLQRSYRLRQLLLHLLIGFEWNKDISFYLSEISCASRGKHKSERIVSDSNISSCLCGKIRLDLKWVDLLIVRNTVSFRRDPAGGVDRRVQLSVFSIWFPPNWTEPVSSVSIDMFYVGSCPWHRLHAPRRMLTSKALSVTYLAIDLLG